MAEVFVQGLLAALVAGAFTGLGGLCIFLKKLCRLLQDNAKIDIFLIITH